MKAVQVPLPPELVQRLRQAGASDESLSQVVVEAVQLWLETRQTAKTQQEQGLALLRRAGLAMESPQQRALADALLSPLQAENLPGRAPVEAALSQLKVPLSEEIMVMRGERA
jgi:Arc/MetJ-type ribon-helix-helix transcriptional regulator